MRLGQLIYTVTGYVTTPPLPPTSSPGAFNDVMDISPLPQKQPLVAQIEVQSPSPMPTPEDEMMVESPLAVQQQLLDVPKPPVVAE